MGLRNSIESPRPDGERIRVRGSRSRSVSAASGGAAAPPPHLPAASRRAPPSPDRGEGAKRRDKAERDPIGYLFGPDHEIREERFGAAFGGRLAVVDAPCGSGVRRTLAAVSAEGVVTQQSAMDLLRPERLVFAYERAMALAFALPREPRSALLLGLGGGAMLRFARAWFPDCALTVVEFDPAVLDLA